MDCAPSRAAGASGAGGRRVSIDSSRRSRRTSTRCSASATRLVHAARFRRGADALTRAKRSRPDRPAILTAQGRLHRGRPINHAGARVLPARARAGAGECRGACSARMRCAGEQRSPTRTGLRLPALERQRLSDAHVGTIEVNARVSDAVRDLRARSGAEGVRLRRASRRGGAWNGSSHGVPGCAPARSLEPTRHFCRSPRASWRPRTARWPGARTLATPRSGLRSGRPGLAGPGLSIA